MIRKILAHLDEIMTLNNHAGKLVDVLEDMTYGVTRLQTFDSKAFDTKSGDDNLQN